MLGRRSSQRLTSGQKSATVGLVRLKGNPRYVNGSDSFEHPKVFARTSNLLYSTLIGTIIDLL
jgi:hypothetical protein